MKNESLSEVSAAFPSRTDSRSDAAANTKSRFAKKKTYFRITAMQSSDFTFAAYFRSFLFIIFYRFKHEKVSGDTDKNDGEENSDVEKFVRIEIFHSEEESVSDPGPEKGKTLDFMTQKHPFFLFVVADVFAEDPVIEQPFVEFFGRTGEKPRRK